MAAVTAAHRNKPQRQRSNGDAHQQYQRNISVAPVAAVARISQAARQRKLLSAAWRRRQLISTSGVARNSIVA